MQISVVIASLGRPSEIKSLADLLRQQVHQPNRVILSVERPEDVPDDLPSHIEIVYGSRGASVQRNRGIELALGGCDLVAFLDDDYVPSKYFLLGAASMFSLNPNVAGATGLVLADGVTAGGIGMNDALAMIYQYEKSSGDLPVKMVDVSYAYGCNMVFRASAISDIRFDENLPFYSWQEDVDFAARVLSRGRVVKTNAFFGVHRGVTGSRTSGVRFGYSQIVNPIYLLRKGTMRPSHVARIVLKNMIANHIKAFRPEQHIDRIGRVRGNWRGILDFVQGKDDPRRIAEF